MSEDDLPEELILDILRYNIAGTSSEIFLDPANSRAFFHRQGAPASPMTGSHYLLVSQRWRRIGAPLLYASLWLSKAFHTLHVAELFRAHPALAEHVVNLRLDGGFIPHLLDLVSLAPNIRNVFISWDLDMLDDTSTLHKVLPCLHPHTLYLGHQRSNLDAKRQSDALSTQVDTLIAGKWSSLRYVHLAYWLQLTAGTARALQTASSLEKISIHCEEFENWSWSRDLLESLEHPSLHTIEARSTLSPDIMRTNLFKQGVRKAIVDRLTFVKHALEWAEFDEPVDDV